MVPADNVDGGFILPGTVLSGYSVHGRFDSATNRASIGDFAPSTPTSGNVNLSGTGGIHFDFDDVYLDTPAIPLIGFPGTDSDPGTTFVDPPANAGPQAAGPQATETVADEGGAIPINSILAFVGQVDNWRSGERLASRATSPSVDLLSGIPNSGQPAQARDIAGEWARPMMLEMAGGEAASIRQPEDARHDPTSKFDDEDNIRLGRPLSSDASSATPANNSRAARGLDGSRGNADAVPSEDAAREDRRLSSASQQPVSLVFSSHGSAAHSLVRPNASDPSESAFIENGQASVLTALNESAYAEVYDELGASDAVGAQAVFNRDAWRDSLKVTPLLMILALERIAASNSRRAKRESPGNAGRRQSHARAAADPADPT
jgi:hypothetical protein